MRYSLVVQDFCGKYYAVSSRKSVHSCLAEATTLPIDYSPRLHPFPLAYGVYDNVAQQYVNHPLKARAFAELN